MRERIKHHIQNRYELYLAFFVPFLLLAVVCIAHGIYPFGDQCYLHIDMYHQYCPFMTEFFHRLKEGKSLMYSWNIGLGSDFIALYAYYLASPMNWLVVLCPKGLIIEFMTLLILIKTGLCGFSFAYYLRSHYRIRSIGVVLFAVLYALCGFHCAYSWNIMWMDGMWLAPLIVLGLERLVQEKKCRLYYITLAVSIFSNYYISIMICVFLVLYYIVLMIERRGRDFVRTSLRFAVYSLLAGGTSAVLLLPEIQILSISGSGTIAFPETVEWYFSVLSGMARSCISVQSVPTTDHWPNLYSGCAVFLLVILYALNRRIRLRSKLPRLALLVFFLVSFANNWLTFFWHGLDFPDGLPARQTFLYSFLLLTVCFEAVHEAKGSRIWHVAAAMVCSVALLASFALFTDTELVSMASIWMTGMLVLAYAILFLLYIGRDKRLRKMSVIFAFLLVCMEAQINLDTTGAIMTSRDKYVKNLDQYEKLAAYAKQENDTFYRIDKYNRLTKNEAALGNYRSASVFSSLIQLDVSQLYRKLGMEGGKNYYCYNGATPFTAALFSVKYLMTDSPYEASELRTLAAAEDGMYLYENKYTLPVGYVVEPELEEKWLYQYGSGIFVQNDLCRALGIDGQLYTKLEVTEEPGRAVISVKEDMYVVADYSGKTAKTITADYGYKKRSFSKVNHSYLLDLGWCATGTDIELSYDGGELLDIEGYRMNLSVLDAAYRKLNQTTLEDISFTDTSLRGKIDIKKEGKLVLSVPAEPGWSVYVDGKQTQTEEFCDALLAVTLQAGTHEVAIKYKTPGLVPGAVVSLVCIGSFVLLCLLQKRKRVDE